ncbi:HAD family hydrolase [Costertonia aggregata]|uniref:HAD family hydrolase n=2 Tax=Costertonia aggregata TaxID=343403 RepID=A0A7H9AUK7_9FLAO|nr:HAD family hydrolase [Costertonia aggregata]
MLCSDLDGTLLTTKSDVSHFTVSQISKIKEQVRIILVSARMPKSMKYVQRDLGIDEQPIICYNGALVLDGKKEIHSIFIQIDALSQIHLLAEKNNVQLGIYCNDEWYVEKDSERVQKEIRYTKANPVFKNTLETILDLKKRKLGAHKIMLMGTKQKVDIIFPILRNSLGNILHFYRSNDTLIEVAPKSVSKLSAIKLLLKKEETLANVIAFGDNYNDLEMLKNVGCGVAVANARHEVKKTAKHITLSNIEDGVAHFVKGHLII